MDEDKCWAEFVITDLSKGLSIEEVQNAAFSLFTTPMKLPKESPKRMTIEEFILGKSSEEGKEK